MLLTAGILLLSINLVLATMRAETAALVGPGAGVCWPLAMCADS